MNLYKISQNVNNGYDTYDSAVVAAENEDAARHTNPRRETYLDEDEVDYFMWAAAKDVVVKYLGVADPSIEAGVIVASFNAG